MCKGVTILEYRWTPEKTGKTGVRQCEVTSRKQSEQLLHRWNLIGAMSSPHRWHYEAIRIFTGI
jgi:hypothetical protein